MPLFLNFWQSIRISGADAGRYGLVLNRLQISLRENHLPQQRASIVIRFTMQILANLAGKLGGNNVEITHLGFSSIRYTGVLVALPLLTYRICDALATAPVQFGPRCHGDLLRPCLPLADFCGSTGSVTARAPESGSPRERRRRSTRQHSTACAAAYASEELPPSPLQYAPRPCAGLGRREGSWF